MAPTGVLQKRSSGMGHVPPGTSAPTGVLLKPSATRTSAPTGTLLNPTGSLPGATVSPQCTASSASVLNLLPMANAQLDQVAGGIYIGDGHPPVPLKLAQKIRRWEFVDMGELLPEFWSQHQADDATSKRPMGRRTHKVTEIFTWVQCYAAWC